MTKDKPTGDKLRDIVTAGLSSGWEPIKSNPRVLQIGSKLNVLIEYDYENNARKDRRVQQAYISVSLPDLIADSAFMKAVYGEDVYQFCTNTKCNDHEKVDEKNDCAGWDNGMSAFDARCEKAVIDSLPIWKYHSHKALDLLLDGGDAISYLHNKLQEAKDE